MRILFMGTPDFAVPSLEALIAAGHTVCGVFTQPDKPRNRGMKLQAPPVKVCALAHNIPVYQPVKSRDGAALALIQELAPELIVVAAYGRILPDEILAAPPKGCINVHSSLLPKYRGAAPIHWAVLNGDSETGVTIMHMAHDLDAGDIIAQAATPIDPDETVVALHDRLAVLGAESLVNVVADIAAGTATRTPRSTARPPWPPC
ncbi:MAG: methionyl-tRNA formyltransferase [Flavonifractor plautii]